MQPLNNIAQKGKLSLGLVFPIESYTGFDSQNGTPRATC